VAFHHFPSSAALAEASGTFTVGTYQYVQHIFLREQDGKIKVKRWRDPEEISRHFMNRLG
jgi:hypothetical protein